MVYRSSFRTFVITIAAVSIVCSCSAPTPGSKETPVMHESEASRGIGRFKDVPLTHPLDIQMVGAGKNVYAVKCESCHKLTTEKLVGPGWKGITDRRTPEWVMNFITNTDEMIEKDPQAQALMEICMVRMPNQHLSENDARAILEFMRSNDNKN